MLNSLPHEHATTVSIDNHHGAFQATQHLIDQGWRKIGLISMPTEYAMGGERYRGWRDCLRQNDLLRDDSWVADGEWTAAGGAQAMAHLLAAHPDLDAVFAANDAMALGAMCKATEQGRTIGADLGVIGYENLPESAFYCPPLSTVHQRIFELGQEAVRALVRQIELADKGEPPPPPVLILSRPELLVRASSLKQKRLGD